MVSYAHDTSNPLMLKFARAFQAELALRQGRFAEASYWAEHFVTDTLVPMYRFYVPQLTLVRVLLAKDTVDSRKQAADLLKELYDFVVFTNNKRFQIDVLALQALLYDSQGERSTALESLTHALQLAEPGGFIRFLVDLGPQMTDLLIRLHKQRISVRYIEKILAVFKDDQHKMVPAATDHESPSPHHPISKPVRRSLPSEGGSPRPPVSQPLIEPLTNRELDVLELLAQRLSTKEIAEKIFISTTTVNTHLRNIYGKLNVKKRREAVEKACSMGILTRK